MKRLTEFESDRAAHIAWKALLRKLKAVPMLNKLDLREAIRDTERDTESTKMSELFSNSKQRYCGLCLSIHY